MPKPYRAIAEGKTLNGLTNPVTLVEVRQGWAEVYLSSGAGGILISTGASSTSGGAPLQTGQTPKITVPRGQNLYAAGPAGAVVGVFASLFLDEDEGA